MVLRRTTYQIPSEPSRSPLLFYLSSEVVRGPAMRPYLCLVFFAAVTARPSWMMASSNLLFTCENFPKCTPMLCIFLSPRSIFLCELFFRSARPRVAFFRAQVKLRWRLQAQTKRTQSVPDGVNATKSNFRVSQEERHQFVTYLLSSYF
jgi:hypothetical protein